MGNLFHQRLRGEGSVVALVVGESRMGRLMAVLRRRSWYIVRFAFWAVRHRSLRNVRWVLAFEGVTWE